NKGLRPVVKFIHMQLYITINAFGKSFGDVAGILFEILPGFHSASIILAVGGVRVDGTIQVADFISDIPRSCAPGPDQPFNRFFTIILHLHVSQSKAGSTYIFGLYMRHAVFSTPY